MNNYDRKDVVVVLFPSTDGSVVTKKRPALVMRKNGREDLLLCMMTTVSRGEPEEVYVQAGEANLKKDTYIRTHKMMTVHESFISGTTGKISDAIWQNVIDAIKAWLIGIVLALRPSSRRTLWYLPARIPGTFSAQCRLRSAVKVRGALPLTPDSRCS